MTAIGWIGILLTVGFWGLLWLAAVVFGPDTREGVELAFTEWAKEILRRSHEAARRFSPGATVRAHREGDDVAFTLTDEPAEGDELVTGDGFELLVERGLEGTVDVVEPHDRLILRPPGDLERSVRPH